MKLYAIHAPRAAEALAGPEGARAARLGFSLAALAFGPLWLLVRGAWWALLGYFVAAAALVALAGLGVLGPGAAAALAGLGQLYLGFEGRALAQRARERGGRALVDVIYAGSALEAEKIFLERAFVAAPAPTRRAAPLASPDVIGLFPEPGR
ncbi:MAG: DUF2628 domain-containing protein [Pseudomonadota bacterium]|nr:DUF2628 domain-containing protein [Pseudomonadota bacterium]